ncbi:MAG: selenide, water dikinase SelD [Pirellulales bacterium]
MNSKLPRHDIVLIGAGHTNAHVLRMWRMTPLADTRLTCISNFPIATYSGMLTGTLAGVYSRDRMQIDLVRLCAASAARLICSEVTGLDLGHKQVLLRDRPPVRFDVLSVGIGSVPELPASGESNSTLLTIKPMQTFLERLDGRLAALETAASGRPWRIAVVGAGAGGVEIAFCLPFHLVRQHPGCRYELTLIDAAPEMLSGVDPRMIRRVRRELVARGVELILGHPVEDARDGRLMLKGKGARPVDLAIWATSAAAPPLLARLGLPTDEKGFLLTRATLQTVADAPVFAVGDSGTNVEYPTPKAGVYAVRQGPVLWENLRRTLRGEARVPYVPQRGFLKLLATGDGRAILGYKGLSFHAAWCKRLKNYIDTRFMAKYQDYSQRNMSGDGGQSDAPMQCAGCGGKLAGAVLSRALARLKIPPAEHVLLGLDRPDDAAIVRLAGGGPVAITVDFFTPFVDDPYFVGRVAALNAASDLFALGSRPAAALALAAVEPGSPLAQEQFLYELLAGAQREFEQMGATLVGGHTIESPKPLVGFSLIAAASDRPSLKDGLRPGDYLVLTKPLGSGILLAAHMRAKCRAEWFQALERVLLASNQHAAQCAHDLDTSGITDVTGFGLAGHLLEMLRASEASCELWLADLPLLPGARELLAAGVESTLAPANRSVEAQMEADADTRSSAEYPILFDPQTSGGLLVGVAEKDLGRYLDRTGQDSDGARLVGRVTAHSATPTLRVLRRRPD